MKHLFNRQRGFTLIELILVIVLTSTLAVVLSTIFKPVIDGYFGVQRRAKLTDMADTALRTMGRDIRLAIPNSVRDFSATCFELIPSSGGGRFRMENDAVTPGSDKLDLGASDNSFDTLSPLLTTPVAGDWVVVGNESTADVYNGTTRAEITNINPAIAGIRENNIEISSSNFPATYDGGRFFIVPNSQRAVSYICEGAGVNSAGTGTGTLYRVTRNFTASPGTCPATSGAAVLATRIQACSFGYQPNQGAIQQSGFLALYLELAEEGETISLAYGAHVDNIP